VIAPSASKTPALIVRSARPRASVARPRGLRGSSAAVAATPTSIATKVTHPKRWNPSTEAEIPNTLALYQGINSATRTTRVAPPTSRAWTSLSAQRALAASPSCVGASGIDRPRPLPHEGQDPETETSSARQSGQVSRAVVIIHLRVAGGFRR
jgi:hypothetical protein